MMKFAQLYALNQEVVGKNEIGSPVTAPRGAQELSRREEAGDGGLHQAHLSVVLSARYAALVSGWNGEMDDEFRRKLRALRTLCQDIVELRRGDHCAERLRLDLDRFAEANKADEQRALEIVLAEIKQWPDVRKAFQDAFALFKQKKNGGSANMRPADVSPPNPAGAN